MKVVLKGLLVWILTTTVIAVAAVQPTLARSLAMPATHTGMTGEIHGMSHQHSATDEQARHDCLIACLESVPSAYLSAVPLGLEAPKLRSVDLDWRLASPMTTLRHLVAHQPWPRGPPGPHGARQTTARLVVLETARLRI